MQDVKTNRNSYIGGSDIPAIMNISPFKKRIDLLREKAGLQESDFEGNQYTEYGNAMEETIRNKVSEYMNCILVEGHHTRVAEDKPLAFVCHTDGENEDTIVEIKTTSIIHDNVDDYMVYLVQLLYYMNETGRKNGILAVYERPDSFDLAFDNDRLHIYHIKVEEYSELISRIYEAIERFLVDFKFICENPFATEMDLMPDDIAGLTDKIIEFESALSQMKEIETKMKKAKEVLYNKMLENGIKSYKSDNGYSITLIDAVEAKTVEENVFNVDTFETDHPRLYKKYVKTVTREVNGRKGYVKITVPKGDKK